MLKFQSFYKIYTTIFQHNYSHEVYIHINFLSWKDTESKHQKILYIRIAPLMRGRISSALNLEKILNISLAFFAVPSWSRKWAVIRVSTRSIRSLYLENKILVSVKLYFLCIVTDTHKCNMVPNTVRMLIVLFNKCTYVCKYFI
jgi:hypothetical protein